MTGSRRPRVALVSLGGTIAMTTDGPTGTGVAPRLTAAQLVAAVPGLDRAGIDVEVHDIRKVPGASLSIADLGRTMRAITDRFKDGVDGAVVTQGTDTIEETSWLLDLLHTGPQPIVVTGAMRNPTLAGADGPANVLAAVQVAAHTASRDLGCLVVFADEIHAARSVRKTHSSSVTAFASPGRGPIGQVTEGTARLWTRSSRLALPVLDAVRPPHSPPDPPALRVLTVPVALADDGYLLRAAADGAHRHVVHGVVIAGFGVGHVPAGLLDTLDDLVAAVPVVLTTRTGAGSVATATYAFPGSESDLLARGLIPGGDLDPYKARLLLHLLVAADATAEQIRDAVQHVGGLTPQPRPDTVKEPEVECQCVRLR